MDWFESWFDSPYYDLLYQKRDLDEANRFMDALINRLQLQPGDSVLDIGCGTGRHASVVSSKGLRYAGIDLSQRSIDLASARQLEGAKYFKADMRSFNLNCKYNAALNLFTSFGYFQQLTDNSKVLANIHRHLIPGGLYVMDYLNVETTLENLVPQERCTIDNITFNIQRFVRNGSIHKQITFEANGKFHEFEERVQAFTNHDLTKMLKDQGFTPIEKFGDYNLNSFEPTKSDRLIILSSRA